MTKFPSLQLNFEFGAESCAGTFTILFAGAMLGEGIGDEGGKSTHVPSSVLDSGAVNDADQYKFVVSPDDQRLLMIARAPVPGSLVVVLNWTPNPDARR